jgi:hypothetical protein
MVLARPAPRAAIRGTVLASLAAPRDRCTFERMAFPATSALGATVLLILSLSVGCESEQERFPPPQPYPGGPIDNPGGADGSGGDGGGGAGGATTTVMGPGPVLNNCECAFGLEDLPDCSNCSNSLTTAGGSCSDEIAACNADMTCSMLTICRVQCGSLSGADLEVCVQACYADLDLQAPENQIFVALMGCVCTACSAECAPDAAIACP